MPPVAVLIALNYCLFYLINFRSDEILSLYKLRVSLQSPNIEGGNEIKLGAVYRSPRIELADAENPGEPQLRNRLMKAVRLVIASYGVPKFKFLM